MFFLSAHDTRKLSPMTSAAHIAPPIGQRSLEDVFGHALVKTNVITANDLKRVQKIQDSERKSQGYTLTELLVVLAIMALMTSTTRRSGNLKPKE